MPITSAVRNYQLNKSVSPVIISYLYKGRDMTAKDYRLIEGVLFRTYFTSLRIVASAATNDIISRQASVVLSTFEKYNCNVKSTIYSFGSTSSEDFSDSGYNNAATLKL